MGRVHRLRTRAEDIETTAMRDYIEREERRQRERRDHLADLQAFIDMRDEDLHRKREQLRAWEEELG